MFIHFGMNSFTGNEWGDGTDDPQLFNPSELDANQWVSVAKDVGFEGIIFTAKHHDGFSLWPSALTDYSLAASPWKGGGGDIVRELADAALSAGMKFGIYLSPWDRHEPSYSTPEYNDFYDAQLVELLSNYGDIFELWFDGAREPGLPDPGYDFQRWFNTVYQYQPNALIFGGKDIRWVGNEDGIAPEEQWSVIGDGWWFPSECDTPNRPGWFWRESEDARVLSGLELLDIYFTSVGRNCVLLLNLPVNNKGLISTPDIVAAQKFRQHLDTIFDDNLIIYGEATASTTGEDSTSWAPQNAIDAKGETFWVAADGEFSGWIEIALEDSVTFDIISIQEPIQYGQRISEYDVQIWNEIEGWVSISSGTTIGYKKLDRLSVPVAAKRIRLSIIDAVGVPAIQEFGLFYEDI